MEQIKVSDLASEFDLKSSFVISELKKIGVWVPSSTTPLDQDIAVRIRRRLQLMVEFEQEEQAKADKAKEKKAASATAGPRKAAKRTIKELGKTRKAQKSAEPPAEEEAPIPSPLAGSLKPRKGKASYRRPEESQPERVEVSIDDEPLIEMVEAQVPQEVLEAAMQPPAAAIVEESKAEPAGTVSEKTEDVAEVAQPGAEAKDAALAPTAEETAGGEQAAVTEAGQTAEATVEAPAAPEQPEAQPERLRTKLAPPPRKLKIIKRPAKPPVEAHKPSAPSIKVVKKAPPAATPPLPSTPSRSQRPVSPRPAEVTLSETVTVKELSERINVKSKDVLRELMKRGVMATINQSLDQQTAETLCEIFGVVPSFVTFEESVIESEQVEEKPEDRQPRAPVVTVMGHVDHGKTTLLDTIRQTKVAAGEAGGITQHIGAYHVRVGGKKIVFLDTPGHEAFTMMRARGARVTDIVVLVVAADDGVMPQTREAIDHARAAGVPIIVAINKIDKADANPQRVKQELTEYQLVSEDWGGDTVMVEVSSTEGTNVEHLLEMILLVAELQELTANPKRAASGVVLEAKLDKGRGAVATVLIQNGTLAVGDSFIAGTSFGKVRAMFNDRGSVVKKVGPSSAVEILGLQGMPQPGDPFQAVEDASKARQIVEYRQEKEREVERSKSTKVSLDDLYARMLAGEVKELPIVLKADAQGSVEVLRDTLEKLSTEKVKIKIIHRGVGAISETDVLLASASNAIVIGFNVRPEQNAQAASEREEVDIRLYTVIYEIAKEIRQAMLGLLEPTVRESYRGRAEVRNVFRVPKFGTIAGCYVLDGVISRNSEVRLLRDNVVIYQGRIDSLKRFKDDAATVKSGYECGLSIANFNDIKLGDVIEAFVKEEVAPELS